MKKETLKKLKESIIEMKKLNDKKENLLKELYISLYIKELKTIPENIGKFLVIEYKKNDYLPIFKIIKKNKISNCYNNNNIKIIKIK